MWKTNHRAVTWLAGAFSLSFLYLMAAYSTTLPSQINGYLSRSRSQYLPGKAVTWSVARKCPDTTSDIMVVFKTGGTETFKRLPIHLETTLRCVKNSLIVSDIDLEIGDHRTVDVIADLDNKTLEHGDFDLYHLQKQYHAVHGDLASLIKGQNGWDLDKYKFIPAMRRAWLQATPKIEWFLFIEADTSIDLGNLRKMLDHLKRFEDPRKTMRYIGSEALINDYSFAHGGSGYLLSRLALEKVMGESPDAFVNIWGPQAIEECCGDFLVGRVLQQEINLTISDARPFFQGAKPEDAWYADDLWCHPVVTMHHTTPQQISELWSLGSDANLAWNRPNNHTLLWKDVYHAFIKPNLKDFELDWDNGSSDADKIDNIGTHIDCKQVCLSDDACLQWSYVDGHCSTAKRIMLGASKRVDGFKKKAFSGWILERIQAFEEENSDCKINWDFRKE